MDSQDEGLVDRSAIYQYLPESKCPNCGGMMFWKEINVITEFGLVKRVGVCAPCHEWGINFSLDIECYSFLHSLTDEEVHAFTKNLFCAHVTEEDVHAFVSKLRSDP